MKDSRKDLDATVKLMGALLRQPPKPHEKMKIGKTKRKKAAAKRKPQKP
jgi:hypothetical protein